MELILDGWDAPLQRKLRFCVWVRAGAAGRQGRSWADW